MIHFFTPKSLETLRLMELKDQLTMDIDSEVDHRIADHILLNLGDRIKYEPLGVYDAESYLEIKCNITQPTIITDINIHNLIIVSNDAEIHLNSNSRADHKIK